MAVGLKQRPAETGGATGEPLGRQARGQGQGRAAAVESVVRGCVEGRQRLGGGAGDKAETRRSGRETAGLHVRRAKSQSASGKASEALGGRACSWAAAVAPDGDPGGRAKSVDGDRRSERWRRPVRVRPVSAGRQCRAIID